MWFCSEDNQKHLTLWKLVLKSKITEMLNEYTDGIFVTAVRSIRGFTLTGFLKLFLLWTDWNIHSSPFSFGLTDRLMVQLKHYVLIRSNPSGLNSACPPRHPWPALWRSSAQPAGNDCWGSWRDTCENTITVLSVCPSYFCLISWIYTLTHLE